MEKLITVHKAKEQIKKLERFVELAESYKANTLEELIVKEYAYNNSIPKVLESLNQKGILKKDGSPLEKADIVEVLRGKSSDEFQKIVKRGYWRKIKNRIKR